MTKALSIGQPFEIAVWLTGEEPAGMIELWKLDCVAELNLCGREHGVIMNGPTFTQKLPGEDRVPQVPDHISGPDVRLLVCEATVAGVAKPDVIASTGFVADLDARDLARLRKITRRAYAKTHPGQARLSDIECDAVIERVGPESALKTLRGGVDSHAIH